MEVLDSKRAVDDPFKKNVKYADLDLIPDGWVGEIVDGDLYAQYGVAHLWFADPALEELEVHTLDGKSYRVTKTAGGSVRATLAPFAHAIELAKLWQR